VLPAKLLQAMSQALLHDAQILVALQQKLI